MGAHHQRLLLLASAHVAEPHGRLPAVRVEPGSPPRRERDDLCGHDAAGIRRLRRCNRRDLEERPARHAVRRASAARGAGGMDCRTQGTAGGLLLVRRHSRVRVLHTSTVMEAISLVRGHLRPRLDVQAGCRHSSAGAAAARCLAAESRRENLAVEAVARKTAARDPLGRVKRADLHRAAAGGRHDLLVPADTRRSCATRGGRLCNLCLSDNLAVSAGAALSVSVERAAGDSHRLSCAAHRDHGAGVGVSRASAVSALRLALVRGRVAPDDRSGAGRRAVTRGPIRLYPCDGPARDGRLGRRPVADGAPAHTRDGPSSQRERLLPWR